MLWNGQNNSADWDRYLILLPFGNMVDYQFPNGSWMNAIYINFSFDQALWIFHDYCIRSSYRRNNLI